MFLTAVPIPYQFSMSRPLTVLQTFPVHGPLTTILVFKQAFNTNAQRLSEAHLAYGRDDAQSKLRFLLLNAEEIGTPVLYRIPALTPTNSIAYILHVTYTEPMIAESLSDPAEYAERVSSALRIYRDPALDSARFQVEQLFQVMTIAEVLHIPCVRDILLPSSGETVITEELLTYSLHNLHNRPRMTNPVTTVGEAHASAGTFAAFDKLALKIKTVVNETVKEIEQREAQARRPPTRSENIEIDSCYGNKENEQ
jgi:hypothetical protein